MSFKGHEVFDVPAFAQSYKCSTPGIDFVAVPCLKSLIAQEELFDSCCVDLGCGSGFLIEHLVVERFASIVVGVDASATMLARARARFAKSGIFRVVNNAVVLLQHGKIQDEKVFSKIDKAFMAKKTFESTSKEGAVKEGAASLIISCLVLHYLNDSELDVALGRCFNALEPGGVLAFIVEHPIVSAADSSCSSSSSSSPSYSSSLPRNLAFKEADAAFLAEVRQKSPGADRGDGRNDWVCSRVDGRKLGYIVGRYHREGERVRSWINRGWVHQQNDHYFHIARAVCKATNT